MGRHTTSTMLPNISKAILSVSSFVFHDRLLKGTKYQLDKFQDVRGVRKWKRIE